MQRCWHNSTRAHTGIPSSADWCVSCCVADCSRCIQGYVIAAEHHFRKMPSAPLGLEFATLVFGSMAEVIGQRQIRVIHGGNPLQALVGITLYSAIEVLKNIFSYHHHSVD